MRVLSLAVLFVILLHPATHSAVWEVPSVPCPTIQAGIDLASFGDTVLVLPGSYHENLIMKDGVVLLGRDGASSTFLEPGAPGAPVISCSDLGSATEISGFTIRSGFDEDGAGVHCIRSSPRIASNFFDENVAENVGGAVARFAGSDATIEENVFRANRAGYIGGGVYCETSGPAIRENEFFLNHGEWGGAIACTYGADPDIRGNKIHRNTCSYQGAGIYCRYDCELIIEDNVINLNDAGGTGGGMFIQENSSADIRRNLVANNEASDGGGIQVTMSAYGLCEENTVYGNIATSGGASGITSNNMSTIEVYRCIVARCGPRPAISCELGGTATLDCNCLWGNTTDYYDCAAGPNDFYEDPLFCNEYAGDFTLQSCSPCTDGYGCGQVGAFGVGCDCGSTATTPSTWGNVKAMYR